MKRSTCVLSILMLFSTAVYGQNDASVFKISNELLAGEGLREIEQEDSTRTFYQKKAYDGTDFIVYIVAIGTGIMNEFKGFPFEEFIFWMNGKAIVEPEGGTPFPINTGDYFVQAKGFNGKWNFVDIGGVHLELALIAKHRPDSSFKSPMKQAMIIDRAIISGVLKPENDQIYEGPELTVNLITDEQKLQSTERERMIHVLNGVISLKVEGQPEERFYPGDFFVIPEGLKGQWNCSSLQNLRLLEVYKTKL